MSADSKREPAALSVGMGPRLALLAAFGTMVGARGALAQQVLAPLPPFVRANDATHEAERRTVAPLFAPLRLSLTQGLFPSTHLIAGCATHEDASGNSANGVALERYTFLKLVPRLVLHGFSIGGCPLDAGGGGGLTYEVPLSRTLSLVSSVGAFAQPTPGLVTAPIVTGSARVDIVKRLGWGRTLNFGLGARSRASAGEFTELHFGGSF